MNRNSQRCRHKTNICNFEKLELEIVYYFDGVCCGVSEKKNPQAPSQLSSAVLRLALREPPSCSNVSEGGRPDGL